MSRPRYAARLFRKGDPTGWEVWDRVAKDWIGDSSHDGTRAANEARADAMNRAGPFADAIAHLVDAPMTDDRPAHGKAIRRADLARLPDDTPVAGMAPIGVRWDAVIHKGKVVPAKGCPAGEFAPTSVGIMGIGAVPVIA